MFDSNPNNVSEHAVSTDFDAMVSYKQSDCRRSVRSSFYRQRDERNGKRGRGNDRCGDDRCRNERVSFKPGITAHQSGFDLLKSLHLDEQKRFADEVGRRAARRTRGLAGTSQELQLQAGLLQHLPVSAWTLKPNGTPDFVNQVWLDFAGQTLDFVRSHPEAWMTVVQPEDREAALKAFWEGVSTGQGFAVETRSLRAQDGTYRWHLNQAVVLRDAQGKVLRFVGTTTDIDDQKRAEEALRQAQADLARINRVTTMGELAASLAHEISQPISGAITNVNVCLRKLGHDEPDLDEVRATVTRIGRDAKRAGDIIARIHKGPRMQTWLRLHRLLLPTGAHRGLR
jgi:PAS domain S-box-containing protein